MSPSPFVRDVDEQSFQAEVLTRSATVPVVVDFWAPWCGPCRVLGPLLEREIDALAGRVVLAKIDTDRNPTLASQFGIQGIPAVKAFRDGGVVDEFTGALPAPQIKAWLARLAPPPGLTALAAAEATLRSEARAGAEAALRALLDDPDAGNRTRLLLAGYLLDEGRPDEVPGLLAGIDPRSDAADQIPSVERRLALIADAQAYGGEDKARAALAANPKDLEARWALGCAQAARGATRDALESFLEIVARNRKFRDDGARLAMLALFDSLGAEHELSQEFRRRLQVVL